MPSNHILSNFSTRLICTKTKLLWYTFLMFRIKPQPFQYISISKSCFEMVKFNFATYIFRYCVIIHSTNCLITLDSNDIAKAKNIGRRI